MWTYESKTEGVRIGGAFRFWKFQEMIDREELLEWSVYAGHFYHVVSKKTPTSISGEMNCDKHNIFYIFYYL